MVYGSYKYSYWGLKTNVHIIGGHHPAHVFDKEFAVCMLLLFLKMMFLPQRLGGCPSENQLPQQIVLLSILT